MVVFLIGRAYGVTVCNTCGAIPGMRLAGTVRGRSPSHLDIGDGGLERAAPVTQSRVPVDQPALVEPAERLRHRAWDRTVDGHTTRDHRHEVSTFPPARRSAPKHEEL